MSPTPHDSNAQRRLRRALGKFATGVTVITTRTAEGVRLGVTANSFNSVSLDPPLILWSLAKSAASLPAYQAAEHFAVNVLAENQVHLSDHFAGRHGDKFNTVAFTDGLGEAPLLDGSAARFECRTHALHDGGDHCIIVGEVERFEDSRLPALLYYEGGYAISVPWQDSEREALERTQAARGAAFERGVYFQLVRAVHALQDALAPVYAEFGVSANEVRVLGSLRNSSGRDEAELSHHARAPLPEMRAVLGDLAQRGLVSRHDGSDSVWQLTAQGTQTAAALWTRRLAEEEQALASLAPAEIEVLRRCLQRIGDWGDGEG
ncbi:MAG: flavin reductase [Pseudomonadota bacterium]